MRRSRRVIGNSAEQEPTQPQDPQDDSGTEPEPAEGDTIIELRDGVPFLYEQPAGKGGKS